MQYIAYITGLVTVISFYAFYLAIKDLNNED